jgi:hypothetical protein
VAAVGIPAAVLSGWFAGHLVHTAVINRFQGDFLQHMQFAASGMRGDPVPGNFLLYLLLAIFSGFTPEPGRMLSALVVVIAAATAAKAWLSVIFVSAESRRAQLRRAPVFGLVAAALCLFTFSPPVANIYLGQIPPNVWHNSTTMLLMPFAIGMFWSSLQFLRTGSAAMLWLTLGLGAVNVAAKASFIFCFLVVFPLAVLVVRRNRRDVLWGWLTTAGVAVVLGLQYFYVYVAQLGSEDAESAATRDGVALHPFRVMAEFSDNIPLSVLVSYAFPIAALLAGGVALRRNAAVRYAGALAFVGLAVMILLKETGPRELHGNFFWQAFVTNYLLFLALVAAAVPWLRGTRFGWRQGIVVFAFLVHLVAGVLYLHTFFATGRFV